MKIYSINTRVNVNRFSGFQKQNKNTEYNFYGNGGICDTAVFSGKKYNSDSVLNPTNHCAYCGCKVYSEAQINGIAKEMLQLKASRLDGKIKSVLEKLSEGKHSREIATAKQIENQDEIDFFKTFRETAEKRPFLKGEAIFKQVYGLEADEAQELLTENMQPLLRTIDHVSPQNQNQENNNVDANLVEACYCCNHDLKKGSSFEEFYTMFPSIQYNMPKDKFEFANAQLLNSSKQEVRQRLSAANILKHLENLFIQRSETITYLDTINFKIKNCNEDINSAIEDCEFDISEKRKQIAALRLRERELESGGEYQAMLRRNELEEEIRRCEKALEGYANKQERINNALNGQCTGQNGWMSVKNSDCGICGTYFELTEEEKAERTLELKKELDLMKKDIAAKTAEIAQLQAELDSLNEAYPPNEKLAEKQNIADIPQKISTLKAEIEFLNSTIKELESCRQRISDIYN